MAARLRLEELSVRSLRNLERVDFQPAPHLNVVFGDNGQGKTTLLEAIYFLATSRSFRTARLAHLVGHGATAAAVRGVLVEEPPASSVVRREQSAAVHEARAAVRIDGNKPASLVAYATRSPVVVFHPDELALSTGPAVLRRTLLDRIALFLDPRAADDKARYHRAFRARSELLRSTRRPSPAIGDELAAFEHLCALHGSALTHARARAALTLSGELLPPFHRLAPTALRLEASYVPGGSSDPEEAARELALRRQRDARSSGGSFGPHRDDLELSLDSRPARHVASQGQHRMIALALKLAEASAIHTARGIRPLLLLDDVSSELDPARTDALFTLLAGTADQIFLTTTRPDLIPEAVDGDRHDYEMVAGVLRSVRPRP